MSEWTKEWMNESRSISSGFTWLSHHCFQFVLADLLLFYPIIFLSRWGSFWVKVKKIKTNVNWEYKCIRFRSFGIFRWWGVSTSAMACHPLPGPNGLPQTLWLTCTNVLGHDREGVGLLLRFDEDGDSRGRRDLPEKAAHSLRGLLQQGSHILRWLL